MRVEKLRKKYKEVWIETLVRVVLRGKTVVQYNTALNR